MNSFFLHYTMWQKPAVRTYLDTINSVAKLGDGTYKVNGRWISSTPITSISGLQEIEVDGENCITSLQPAPKCVFVVDVISATYRGNCTRVKMRTKKYENVTLLVLKYAGHFIVGKRYRLEITVDKLGWFRAKGVISAAEIVQ